MPTTLPATLDCCPLVPFPHSVRPTSGNFDCRGRLVALWRRAAGRYDFLDRQLEAQVIESRVTEMANDDEPSSLVLRSPDKAWRPPESHLRLEHPQAYELQIAPEGIAIRAGADQGMLLAWTTLSQLREMCGTNLPCGYIHDQPALERRMLHLDMKGLKPHADYLLELLPKLAHIKINAVLLELEDDFRYEAYPDIAHPHALPRSFWHRFAQTARDLHIQVIPLLQTWGHLHYILRLPQYRHLAEGPDRMIGEICPLHPETWPMLSRMIDEIREAFPDSTHLHLGMDEVFLRGACPRCKPVEDRMGRHEFFAQMLNQRTQYAASKGFIPIFWGSSLKEFPIHKISHANHQVKVNTPDGAQEHAVHMIIANYGVKAPHGGATAFDAILQTTADSQTPGGEPPSNPFGMIPIGQQSGFTAVIGSAVQYSAGVMGLVPDLANRRDNVLACAQASKHYGVTGALATWWARGHSNLRNNAPFEAAWYAIDAFADFSWRDESSTCPDDFNRRWQLGRLGLNESDDTRAVDAINAFTLSTRRMVPEGVDHTDWAIRTMEAVLESVERPDAKRHLEAVALGMRVHRFNLKMQFAQYEAEFLLPARHLVPETFIQECLDNVDELLRQANELSRDMRDTYCAYLRHHEVEELVRCVLDLAQLQAPHIKFLLRSV